MSGYFIIEFSEMLATMNAKSVEDIKSFLSRQKETYKVPYERQAKDRLRQCVFIGTTNKKSFYPLIEPELEDSCQCYAMQKLLK